MRATHLFSKFSRWTRGAAGLALALALAACCTTEAPMVPPPPPVAMSQPVAYRYYGQHPIPDAVGGGWCYVPGVHLHNYYVDQPRFYSFTNNVFYYVGPQVCTFGGPHPIVSGGWCYIGYPHSHNYCPPPAAQSYYSWEPTRRYFVYNAPVYRPAPRYVPPAHPAGPAYAPAPGPRYVPPTHP